MMASKTITGKSSRMATLIPTLGAGVSRMTSGEKRLAQRLQDKLDAEDLQQEQLARSLGDGHRVIHGVAGSGKTMILGYRAEYLAKMSQSTGTPSSKPILILCFNEPLGVKLASIAATRSRC